MQLGGPPVLRPRRLGKDETPPPAPLAARCCVVSRLGRSPHLLRVLCYDCHWRRGRRARSGPPRRVRGPPPPLSVAHADSHERSSSLKSIVTPIVTRPYLRPDSTDTVSTLHAVHSSGSRSKSPGHLRCNTPTFNAVHTHHDLLLRSRQRPRAAVERTLCQHEGLSAHPSRPFAAPIGDVSLKTVLAPLRQMRLSSWVCLAGD